MAVSIFRPEDNGENDVFWRLSQNYHVYEEAFRAANPGPGSRLTWDTAGAQAKYDIGLAKARALDKARKNLIEASHAKAVATFGAAAGNQMSRSVDGVEGASEDSIRL